MNSGRTPPRQISKMFVRANLMAESVEKGQKYDVVGFICQDDKFAYLIRTRFYYWTPAVQAFRKSVLSQAFSNRTYDIRPIPSLTEIVCAKT